MIEENIDTVPTHIVNFCLGTPWNRLTETALLTNQRYSLINECKDTLTAHTIDFCFIAMGTHQNLLKETAPMCIQRNTHIAEDTDMIPTFTTAVYFLALT